PAQEQRDGSFGFSDLKVFRLGSGGGPWHVTDLDGDDDTDMAIWVGERGELILFLHDPETKGFIHRSGGNTLVDPDGWKRETIAIRADVEAISSGDLDNDGHLDLILSCPKANRIEIRWGAANENRFKTDSRIRLREIARGDATLNVEIDRTISQTEKGTTNFTATVRVLSREGIHEVSNIRRGATPTIKTRTGTAAGPSALVHEDFDGDGWPDLLTVSTASSDRAFPLRLRPGSDHGYGPEILLESENSRFLGLAPTSSGSLLLLGDRDRPVLRGVKISSGQDPRILPNPEIYPLSAAGIGNGSMAVGDLDGDGDPDVVITDVNQSLLRPYWNQDGKLLAGRVSPTLKKPTSVLIRNQQVFVTSSEEGGVGRSIREIDGNEASEIKGFGLSIKRTRNDEGFSFPELLDEEVDTSNLIAITSPREDGPLLTLHKIDNRNYELRYGELKQELKSGREPAGLHSFGSPEQTHIVVEIPFETPRIFRLTDSAFEVIKTPATVESGGSVQAGAEGELLLAKDGRCRIVSIIDSEAQVKRQIDAPGGSARVVTALRGRFDPQQKTQMILVDAGEGLIHLSDGIKIFASAEGPFQKVRNGLNVDLDGDGLDEILLLDQRSLMVIRPASKNWSLKEVFSRRQLQEESRATGSAPGDLNGDGITDLVIIDGVRGELEILAGGSSSANPGRFFEPALSFPVFEKKTFRGAGRGIEPRKVINAELTGDSSVDTVILVHDRLIIYPQDSGEDLR
ncbi:MAG: VCBS repeat-containing protein, partial [Planctomycetota bacterium]